jgi:CHAD domain-containing protein
MRTGSGAPGWTFDMAKKNFNLDESLSAQASACVLLPKMMQAYFKAGRKLTGAPSSPAAMHKFRLETKALRYTLELFRSCYGPALERYLPALRSIQDCLGAMSDYATTKDLIAARLPADAPERVKMERFLAAGTRRKWLEFRRYWLRTFKQPGQERRWLNYLSHPRTAARS